MPRTHHRLMKSCCGSQFRALVVPRGTAWGYLPELGARPLAPILSLPDPDRTARKGPPSANLLAEDPGGSTWPPQGYFARLCFAEGPRKFLPRSWASGLRL